MIPRRWKVGRAMSAPSVAAFQSLAQLLHESLEVPST